jgi:hypothetical protein
MEIQRRWIWQGAIVLGIVAFVAILIFKANPPKERVELDRPKISHTSGSFVSGPATVDPESFLNYKFTLNTKKRLVGKFTTAGYKGKVECLVLDEKNFELFKNGGEFQRRVGTGSIPGGKIDRTFDPGIYYLVFDNRLGKEKVDLAEADFSIE